MGRVCAKYSAKTGLIVDKISTGEKTKKERWHIEPGISFLGLTMMVLGR